MIHSVARKAHLVKLVCNGLAHFVVYVQIFEKALLGPGFNLDHMPHAACQLL